MNGVVVGIKQKPFVRMGCAFCEHTQLVELPGFIQVCKCGETMVVMKGVEFFEAPERANCEACDGIGIRKIQHAEPGESKCPSCHGTGLVCFDDFAHR